MATIEIGTHIETKLRHGDTHTGKVIELRPPLYDDIPLYSIWLDQPYRDEDGKDAYSVLLGESEFEVLDA